jgi:Type IV secretion-system coupling protein DNA-binding domain
MNSTQIAYNLGDPVPSGCQPYVLFASSGAETWYTTCEKPMPPGIVASPSPTVAPVQQTQPYTNTTTTTQMAPLYQTYSPYSNGELFTFFAMLPSYIAIIIFVFIVFLILYGISRYHLVQRKLEAAHTLLSVKPTVNTTESALATEQLFGILYSYIGQKTFLDNILHVKKSFSVELVATRNEGIRYIIHTTKDSAISIKKALLSYLPGVEVQEVNDYIPDNIEDVIDKNPFMGLLSYRFTKHFSIPLEQHKTLTQHDPIAYLTGNMTKLKKDELIALQFVLSPLGITSNRSKIKEAEKIASHLWQGKNIDPLISRHTFSSFLFFPIRLVLFIFFWVLRIVFGFIFFAFSFASRSSSSNDIYALTKSIKNLDEKRFTPTPSQQAIYTQVNEKLQQPLFEASMRLLVIANNNEQLGERMNAINAALGTFDNAGYQQLFVKQHQLLFNLPQNIQRYIKKISLFFFKNRLLGYWENLILSASEVASMYHLPYTSTTKTEDLVTVKAKELPTPLTFKQDQNNLDIIFAKNYYGGEETAVGLTNEERKRSMYVIGGSGTGKSTLLSHMIHQDINNGKGLCIIDPHGDLTQSILGTIPEKRIKDVVYFNPKDRKYPMGLNILELPKNLTEEELQDEKDIITSSIISIFHKLYAQKHFGPRMEHILRYAILAALETENPTLFTIQKILTDKNFRNSLIPKITDPVVKDFWQNEFKRLGSYQQAEVTSPITNKLGQFLASSMCRNILGQRRSTIDFEKIINEGKILICSIPKGSVGEDNSAFFGALLTAKIQLAALRRVHIPENKRREFYLYIDEFQNFATDAFAQILSEARKYGLSIILAHQTIAQLTDSNLTKIILANVGTVICFRTRSPLDEEYILPLLKPRVAEGEIANLPSFSFYCKINAIVPHDAFSGVIEAFKESFSKKTIEAIISQSQKLYGVERKKVEEEIKQFYTSKPQINNDKDKEDDESGMS